MVMFEKDYIMRQIKGMSEALASILFKKGDTLQIEEELVNEQAKELYKKLQVLLKKKQYQDINTLLLQTYQAQELDYLKITIAIYDILNELDEEALEAGGTSRNEMYENLQSIAQTYGFLL